MSPHELNGLMKGIGLVIREQMEPLIKRLEAAEAREPLKGDKGDAGDKGEDGQSVSPDAVLCMVKDLIAGFPKPKDGENGKDADPELVKLCVAETLPAMVEKAQAVLAERLEEAIKGIPIPKDGENGKDADPVDHELVIAEVLKRMPKPENGKDGIDGKDGESVFIEDVLPTLIKQIDDRLDSIRLPENGRDGEDGLDGKSVTIEDVRPLIESELSKQVLEFQRKSADVFEKAQKEFAETLIVLLNEAA